MKMYYVLALIVVFSSWCILNYLRWRKSVYNPIEKITGPPTYPIVGTLYKFFGAKRAEIFKINIGVTNKYKPFYRMWNALTPEVHIMNPEHLEQVMSSSVHIKKSHRYRFLTEWLRDGLLLSDGAKWQQRRKMITPTFHFKILNNFMAVFEEKSKILIDHLEERSDGTSFDVYPYITHCTLDIICETAMGVSINAMTNRNSGYTRAIYSICDLIIKRVFSPLKQTKLYYLMQEGKMFQRDLNTIHSFTEKVIADRRRALLVNPLINEDFSSDMSQRKRLSFLDLLLDASYNLSDDGIREEVDTFMFEGHDTTTVAICWTLFLLANHADIQDNVYQEIKGILHNKKVPSTISELNEMQYLECCIKETLRLYPSVPIIGRRLTEEVIIDGHTIPIGSDLIVHIYNAHRNPEVYPNPDKFNPDNFLPENTINRHPYAYIPFSAGPRNCIGQKFAMYEEKAILASIIRSFEIFPIDTTENITLLFELVLRPVNGVNIALKKRTE